MAYQLAFDLNENAPQEFLQQLRSNLFPDDPFVVADQEQSETTSKKSSAEIETLGRILSGEETIKHHMQFLIKNNHTDMLILKQLKDASRFTCTNNAVVMANGLMHYGTTCDDFLR